MQEAKHLGWNGFRQLSPVAETTGPERPRFTRRAPVLSPAWEGSTNACGVGNQLATGRDDCRGGVARRDQHYCADSPIAQLAADAGLHDAVGGRPTGCYQSAQRL